MAFRSLASDGTCVPRGGRTAEARVAFDPKHQSRRPWLTRVTDFCLRAGLTRVRVRNSYSVLVHLEYFFRFFGLGIFPRTRPFLHYITLHYHLHEDRAHGGEIHDLRRRIAFCSRSVARISPSSRVQASPPMLPPPPR